MAQLSWSEGSLFAVICGLISTFWSDFVCKLYANNEKSTYVFRCKCLILRAPLIDKRCNYNAMIEYVTIRKLKG
jgi:hypothetical protein